MDYACNCCYNFTDSWWKSCKCFLQSFRNIFGGVCGVIVYEISQNPVSLMIFSILILVIVIHIRYNSTRPRLGLITQLTYLVVLYEKYVGIATFVIYEVALVRIIAISVGVLIALIISRVFWPYYAKVELRINISNILHDFVIVYGNIVSSFIKSTPLRLDINHLQSKLQLQIIKSQALLIDAKTEPRFFKKKTFF